MDDLTGPSLCCGFAFQYGAALGLVLTAKTTLGTIETATHLNNYAPVEYMYLSNRVMNQALWHWWNKIQIGYTDNLESNSLLYNTEWCAVVLWIFLLFVKPN